jgi:hypothetical protein
MIIPAAKTVFIDIPKTGSSSMVHFLVHAFSHLPLHINISPSWNVDLCPAQSKLTSKRDGDGFALHFTGVRHEPLISIYKNLPDFHDHFLFSVVRHPFNRFKSFVYETLLHKNFNHFQSHFVSPANGLYTDSWFLNDIKSNSDINQFNLIIYHLNVIKAKGWNNINLCSLPLHIWPQVNFTSLKTPNPCALRILPFEQIDRWIDDFKTELSIWSGVNVNDIPFPNIDPSVQAIFIKKHPAESLKTIPSYQECGINVVSVPGKDLDTEFQAKYPTYDLFLQDYNLEKSRIDKQFGPMLEEYRDLIESVYHDDMVTYGYA